MPDSRAFLLGLLDRDDPPRASAADFAGPHGPALRAWRRAGLVAREPEPHPAPGCPHCGAGVPHRAGGRWLCPGCLSAVDPGHRLAWRLDLAAFLGRLAGGWRLRGGVRRVDDRLWQLGTRASAGSAREFFFRRSGPLSEAAAVRLGAYRRAVVVYPAPAADPGDGFGGPRVCLAELLRPGPGLAAADPGDLLRPGGEVRFDPGTGAVWAGDAWLGEVPVGSREFHFLAALAAHQDRYLPYADLKRTVLGHAGSADGTDEATFCHKLKSRIKRQFVPQIDAVLVTTNKGDGYRLRARGGAS